MAKSRTTYVFYNFVTSIFGQFLSIILQFIVRTVFISVLTKEYLGINGLFSNILQMLSLAELGVGSAILFKLYDPLAKKDNKRITLYLKFYKRVYQVIGLVVTVIGLSLIPFLKYIVNDYESLEVLGINATLIYILYLLKSVLSYFFLAYKSAIIKADQKEYKLNIISYIVTLTTSLLQIILLLTTHSFVLYVAVPCVTILMQNYLNARMAKKLYPYIDDKYDEKINPKEVKEIFKDCGALLLYKINSVVLKATDNIVISMFLGLGMVGMYSNYYILYTTINIIFNKIFGSTLHSLGSLHASNDADREYGVFKTINLISIIVGATAAIGVACVANEFVNSWIGSEWIIPQPFAIFMGIEIFGLAIRHFLHGQRTAMGLFQQAKYRPVFGALINIVVSVLLVRKLGIIGVLIGTILADWGTVLWYDPLIIHKYGLKNAYSVRKYYLKNIVGIIIAVLTGVALLFVCNHFLTNLGWISVIVHAFIICLTVPSIYLLLYRKTDEVSQIKVIIKKILKIKK